MIREFIRVGMLLLVAVVMAGCSSAQTVSTTLTTPADGQARTAGPGDTVLALRSSRPLPNALGGADIFGRTVSTGGTIVRYVGTEGGRAVFERIDTNIGSDATTMNATPLLLPNTSRTTLQGNIGNTPVFGTATTTSTQVLPARGSSQWVTTPGAIRIILGAGQSTVISGTALTVLQVNAQSVAYTVE